MGLNPQRVPWQMYSPHSVALLLYIMLSITQRSADSRVEHEDAAGKYLKDLSQNWQGYGRPAPPSSSPPVAVPRSQQPSGICEGDATSLLEGEEGTQDRPVGSSSPSEERRELSAHPASRTNTDSFNAQLQDCKWRNRWAELGNGG